MIRILVLLTLLTMGDNTWAADYTFSWLPNDEPEVTGYKIHYGGTRRSYTTTVDVGKPDTVDGRVEATITGVNSTGKIHFVCTAYSAYTDSNYSNIALVSYFTGRFQTGSASISTGTGSSF